jgi:hypothetical protein
MYYAKGMRDLLKTTQLNMEFFDDLDNFQLHFIEMCFKQAIDDRMGLLTDVEKYNYHLYEEYKIRQFENMYGIDSDYIKRAA